MKDSFQSLLTTAVEARDPAKMQILADSYTRLFGKVAEAHPDIAMAALALLAPIEYHNYLTAEEATAIASKFINADRNVSGASEYTKGAHWGMDVLKSFLSSRNLPAEEKPYYNWPALWVTVNMIYSDYADTLADLLGSKENERLATAAYKMALRKLKDPDRPQFIRDYFNLD
ncbi:MAG: hypothetical protein J6U45_06495 [Alistipes sp.]|nr:hypothetical protein [Alistipes sp.]